MARIRGEKLRHLPLEALAGEIAAVTAFAAVALGVAIATFRKRLA